MKHVLKSWESLAKHDPLWAIMSHPDKKDNKWEMDEFMETGQSEVSGFLETINRILPGLPRKRALDFGCGAGRLTQALADYFDKVDGIDISPSMINTAIKNNRLGQRIKYHLGKENEIPFRDNSFDFVLSLIVFQHVHKKYAKKYIAEFFRVLKPGGIMVFQALDKCLTQRGKKFSSPIPNPFYKKCTIDMNIFPKKEAMELIRNYNGRLIEMLADRRGGPKYDSYTCYVQTC